MLLLVLAGCGPSAAVETVDPPMVEVATPSDADVDTGEIEPARPAPESAIDSECIDELITAPHVGPGPDRTLFDRALKARAEGNLTEARKSLLELVENHKSSPLVPHAYLMFGEMFFEEAKQDPSKWQVADNFYREVLKYPPPRNKVHFHAANRLAQVAAARGEHAEALSQYVRVLEAKTKFPTAECIDTLSLVARDGAVASYVVAGSPRKAKAFFSRFTSNTPSMLTELGAGYAAKGKTTEAEIVLGDALAAGPDAATCQRIAQLVDTHGLGVSVTPACS